MKLKTQITVLLATAAVAAAPLAMADMSRTEGTIVGAAVGGVAGMWSATICSQPCWVLQPVDCWETC